MSNHLPDDHFHYGGCFPRTPRRSPAVGGNNGNGSNNPGNTRRGLFHIGQGGRTVLPPLHLPFRTSRSPVPDPSFSSNQLPQQETPQLRNDYNAQTYGQTGWPGNQIPGGHQSTSFAPDPRYPQQYGSTLPPLNPSPMQGHSGASNPAMGSSNIRSPTSGYPAGYTPYPQQQANASYPYVSAPDPRNLPPAVPQMGFDTSGSHMPRRASLSVERTVPGRLSSVHGPSPYARNPQMSASGYTPEPPVSEPAIKKKRKRADADQLKVLNETYNRTAFPSTEERIELAKKLGMSARSVQIWFQNKRQSMRQNNRQASTSMPPTTNEPFSASSHGPSLSPVSGYSGHSGHPMAPSNQPYGVPRHDVPTLQQMPARLIPSPTPSSHHRGRSHEEEEKNLRRFSSRPY